MDNKRYSFLKAVVGNDGAAALKKAAEKYTSIEDALIPRAIMAWLGVVGRFDYEGEIPGIDDSYLDFSKNQRGLYDGTIAIGEGTFPFENATVFHLAASVAVAIGIDTTTLSKDVKDIDLARLGKSIDLLAKAKIVSNIEEEVLAKGLPGAPRQQNAPAEPQEATPQAKQPKQQKMRIDKKPVLPRPKAPPRNVKGMRKLKINPLKAHECQECGTPIIKNEQFTGCLCLRDLARQVKLVKSEGHTFLTFPEGMDEDVIGTVLEAMGI
jgi:hypothetical protein